MKSILKNLAWPAAAVAAYLGYYAAINGPVRFLHAVMHQWSFRQSDLGPALPFEDMLKDRLGKKNYGLFICVQPNDVALKNEGKGYDFENCAGGTYEFGRQKPEGSYAIRNNFYITGNQGAKILIKTPFEGRFVGLRLCFPWADSRANHHSIAFSRDLHPGQILNIAPIEQARLREGLEGQELCLAFAQTAGGMPDSLQGKYMMTMHAGPYALESLGVVPVLVRELALTKSALGV